ncbi:MAG: hypothetical protein K2K04_07215 [Clostridia bacterium]|nr:hypothetical protein [Clostridia bacterium]
MRELDLKLTGRRNLGEVVVCIDDKPVKLKKSGYGNLACTYQTESDKVNIKVYRMLDVGGVVWFLTQIIFFLITIFGIFDVHRKERCWVIDFEAEVELKERNQLTLQCNFPRENGAAINIQTDTVCRELSNICYSDGSAKKKLKWLKITKLLLALAIIAIVATVLILHFW